MNADTLDTFDINSVFPNDPGHVPAQHRLKMVKPWSILKSKYRFIPWYDKDAA